MMEMMEMMGMMGMMEMMEMMEMTNIKVALGSLKDSARRGTSSLASSATYLTIMF